MTHLPLTQDAPNSSGLITAFSARLPVARATLETLSIGSFLGICLALIAAFS